MAIKYHQKSKLLLAKTQVDEATVATPVGADAIAIFNADFNQTLTSETFQYTGSEEDRSEGVTITDRYGESSGEFFLPALPLIATGVAATATDFPLAKLFEASGFTVTYGAGTGVAASVVVSNAANAGKFLTLDYLEESPADPTNQNLYRFFACRGIIDLDLVTGSRAKCKINFKGNSYDAAAGHINDFPMVLTPRVVPSYGTQKSTIMPALRQSQVITMELQDIASAFTGVSNFGFNKLTAANLSGRQYDRFLSTQEEGFSTAAVGTDVMVTMLSPKANATFVPERMLENTYKMQLEYGVAPGPRVKLVYDNLQVLNVGADSVGNYKGKALTFKNTGSVTMTFTHPIA